MALATDIALDAQFFDATSTVTLRQLRGAGKRNDVTIHYASKTAKGRALQNAFGGVGIEGNVRTWSLNAAEVGSDGVQPGDEIDDGTDVWSVISADLATLSTRWKCVTRSQTQSGL